MGAGVSSAATLSWAGNFPGSYWDSTVANWETSVPAATAWVNGDAADLPVTSSLAHLFIDDLSGTVQVAGITEDGSASIDTSYLIDDLGPQTLTLTNPNISIGTNSRLTFLVPVAGTVGLNVNSGSLYLEGKSTYTGNTVISPTAKPLTFTNGSALGNTAITGAISVLSSFAPDNAFAGTTGAGVTGATLNTSSVLLFGASQGYPATFTLNQESSFTGTALELNSAALSFSLNNTSADELLVNGPGTADVVGTQIISLTTAFTGNPANDSYTLISDPAGGLNGTFEFSSGLTTESIEITGRPYLLTLSNSPTAETLSLTVVPEPASMACAGIGGLALLRRRSRRMNTAR